MSDDREAILEILQGVEAAFSDLDLARWLTYFHSSYLLMTPQGAVAPSSEDEAMTLLRPLAEELRDRGYARSEMSRASVKLLSGSTALASVEWIRRAADGEEIERLGTTYAFYRGEKGWKIVMVTAHPPDTLLEMV